MNQLDILTTRFFLCLLSLQACAVAQELDLMRNGGAEAFIAGKTKEDPASPSEWTTKAGEWESVESVEKGLLAAEGKRYFRNQGRDSCALEQVVTLPSQEKGFRKFLSFQGQCRSFDSADLAWVRMDIMTKEGTVLQSSRTRTEPGLPWTAFRIILPIDQDAHTARLQLRGTYRSGKACDVGFDAVSARVVSFRNTPASKSMSHVVEVSENFWPAEAKLQATAPTLVNWARLTSKLRPRKNTFAVLRCQLSGTSKAPARLTLQALDSQKRVVGGSVASASAAMESVRLEVKLSKRVRFLAISIDGKGASTSTPILRRTWFSKKRGRNSRFALIQEEIEFSPLSDMRIRDLLQHAAQTAEPRAIAYLESKISDGASNAFKASAFEALALASPTRIDPAISSMRTGGSDHLIPSWIYLRDCIPGKRAVDLDELLTNKRASTNAHRAALDHLIHPDDPNIAERIRHWNQLGLPNHTGNILHYGGSRLPLSALIDDIITPLLTTKANSSHRYNALSLLGQAKHPKYLEVIGNLAPCYKAAYQRATLMRYCGTYGTSRGLQLAIKIAAGHGAAEQRSLDQAMAVVPRSVLMPFLFEHGLNHTDDLVRLTSLARLKVLAKKHTFTPDETAALLKLTNDSSRTITIAAIDIIALLPRSEAIDERFRLLMSNRDPIIAAESLGAAWEYFKGKDDVRTICLQIAARSFDWAPRVAAINLIGKHMPEEGADILFDNLTNPRRQVRSAAIEALTYLRQKETVDALLSRIKHEQGLTLHVLRACLKNLTNFDWGSKEERWMTWWDKQRPDFKLPPRPKGGILVSRAEGYASYYGISIQSRRVAFVIDTSGSMETVERGKSRMERAQEQLIKVIEQFDKHTRFLVIAFSDDPYTYADRLLRATRAERKEAGKRVKELYSEGGTNIFDSIEMAMDIKGVESIFILSDGAPSTGRVVNPEEILDEVKRLNRYSRIRINAISIGGAPAMKNFMQRLAAQNYGSYASF